MMPQFPNVVSENPYRRAIRANTTRLGENVLELLLLELRGCTLENKIGMISVRQKKTTARIVGARYQLPS